MSGSLDNIKLIPCPVERTVWLIGNRWSLLIIRELNLRKGPARYNQLRKSLAPISSKTLSSKLKELEAYGIVAKKIMDLSPPSVEYSLTERGSELSKMIADMGRMEREMVLKGPRRTGSRFIRHAGARLQISYPLMILEHFHFGDRFCNRVY